MTIQHYQVTSLPTDEEIAEAHVVQRARSPRRLTVKSCSVTGQCSRCLDLFTVDLYALGSEIYVTETKYTKWYPRRKERQLVHRPGFCNGDIKLYGSTAGLLPTQKAENNHTGRAVHTPTYQ